MLGITGYVCVPSRPEVAARMAQRFGTLQQATPFEVAASEHCAFGASALGRGPHADGRLYRAPNGSLVAIDGEVFGLGTTGPDHAGQKARHFYDRYQRDGIALLSKVRGAFSIAIWDEPSRTLQLITDPYGLRSLYYTRRGNLLAFGSRVRSVLAALSRRPDIDQDGLADFMLLGMPMGHRTLFQGIELVPAGAVLTLHEGSVRVERYEEVTYARSESSPSTLREATEQLYEAFLEAAAEQMGTGHAFNVPLSGGLDSRIVAALACRFSDRVSTHTMGDAESADLMIAPQVARCLGLPNEAWEIRPEEWIAGVEESVYRTDGMYNPMDAQIMSVARRLSDPEAITLDGTSSIDGYFRFFDPLLHRVFPDYVSHRRHAIKVTPDALLDAQGGLSLPALHASEFAHHALSRVKASLSAMLESIPQNTLGTPFDAMDYMDQMHRVRRFNMMGTVLLRGATEVRHPFFDRRVTQVIRTLRSEHRSREKVVLGQVLRRLSPPAANVPYERTGLPADASVAQHVVRYAKLVGHKALQALLSQPPKRATPVIDYRKWCREQPTVQAFIRDAIAGPQSRSAELLGARTVQAVLHDCFNPRGSGATTFLVGRLLAYELWHRKFCEEQSVLLAAAE